jgi:hypothetical protein
MSDRLALTEAIEDAGIDRVKATRIASVIFDAIHQNVATKADVQAEASALRADIVGLHGEMRSSFSTLRTDMAERFADTNSRIGRIDVAIERLRSSARESENRLLVRLGGWMVVLFGLFFTVLHLWPPR